jgi:sensor histidine kinase YesM
LIDARWWQTIWFWLFLGITILLGAYFYANYRVAKAQAVFAQQRKTEQEALRLKSVTLQSQMNPHFLFNALNSLQNHILNKQDLFALQYIGDFSNLLRTMLGFSFKQSIKLSEELSYLSLYLSLENNSNTTGFDFNIEADDELIGDELIPPMIIQPFIENAIKHGIRHLTDRKGQIHVSFFAEKTYLLCTVSDNGVGRQKADENKSQTHQSAGIQITLDRLSTHTDLPQPVVCYEDIVQNEQVCGTKVVIYLPILPS